MCIVHICRGEDGLFFFLTGWSSCRECPYNRWMCFNLCVHVMPLANLSSLSLDSPCLGEPWGMSSQGQTLENNCLVIRYFWYFSSCCFKNKYFLPSLHLRLGVSALFCSVPPLFNVKQCGWRSDAYVGHLCCNMISDLSAHICTSWSSQQEMMQWKTTPQTRNLQHSFHLL